MDQGLAVAVAALQQGECIIIIDEEREGEADLVFAAEKSTPEKITFMINHTSGILAVPLSSERARELDLPLMVQKNNEKFCTNFTVSVDAIHPDMASGVSSRDRDKTIKTVVYGKKQELSRPGHVFPLIGKSFAERQGHTETSLEMCKLAGLKEVAVIGELMNKDGTMMSHLQALAFAQQQGIPSITIRTIISHVKKK